MGILKAVKKFLELEDAEDNQPEEIAEPAETVQEEEEDEEELIAVITAAIAASLGKKPVLDFRVVSFKKRGDWNKQAYL